MVRVIQIEPPRGDDIEMKIERRKEIIDKIAVRSNRQNPIKSWDLASNDDFQLELFRFFRSKGMFYERRPREWNQRSRELKSVNMLYGSSIKFLTQLIASYHWSNPKLGPALAKKVADLFEGAAYEKIRETKPDLAFQLHIIDSNVSECQRELSTEKVYVRKLKSHSRFAVFAVAMKALKAEGVKLGDPSFTDFLRNQWAEYYSTRFSLWKAFAKACIDHTVAAFKKEAQTYSKTEGEELNYANFFKNQSQITQLMDKSLSGDIKKCARAVLKG